MPTLDLTLVSIGLYFFIGFGVNMVAISTPEHCWWVTNEIYQRELCFQKTVFKLTTEIKLKTVRFSQSQSVLSIYLHALLILAFDTVACWWYYGVIIQWHHCFNNHNSYQQQFMKFKSAIFHVAKELINMPRLN